MKRVRRLVSSRSRHSDITPNMPGTSPKTARWRVVRVGRRMCFRADPNPLCLRERPGCGSLALPGVTRSAGGGDHEQNLSSDFLPSPEGMVPYKAFEESARSLYPGPSELIWHAVLHAHLDKNANWLELPVEFRVESGFDNGVLVVKLFYGRELSLFYLYGDTVRELRSG